MRIPKHWARVSEGGRTSLGWSDTSAGDAERHARERLLRLLALGDGPAPDDWDYYPATPVKEEILETRRFPGVVAVVTRNRAGARVLNTDQVAFVDVDVPAESGSLLGRLFGKRRPAETGASAALARAKAWCEEQRARLRAYRTARGLRLLRLDRLLDPAGEECARMFAALGADPRYAELCRIQRSFRARLSPKPGRVGCNAAPGGHPRSEAPIRQAFEEWLARYERASAGRAVCTLVDELGAGAPLAPAQAIAAFHDSFVLREGAELA